MSIESCFRVRRPLAAVAVGALLAWAPGARAFVSEGDTLHSGLFGLAPGQVAQLNVVHTLPNPNEACAFEVVAIDAGGRVIRRAPATVAPGQSVKLELTYAALAATPADDRSGRKRLRVLVKAFDPQPDPPGCLASLEVYDATSGATRVFISNPDLIPAPR